MPKSIDSELMQSTLAAAGGVSADFREALFERFFAAYPGRRTAFLNLEASSIRMTEETVDMMLGLAQEEKWVWPLVAELVFTHRSYGRLPWEEYEGWMDLTIAEIAARADTSWSDAAQHAWQKHAQHLLDLILEAREGWEEVLPPGYVEELTVKESG